MPVPAVPAFLGVELWFQYFMVDPAGSFLGVGTLTEGLHIVIGT